MSRAHVDASLSALRGDPALTVYDAAVPDLPDVVPDLPYVVLYADLGTLSVEDLRGRHTRLDVTLQTTAVGSTREQAQWAAQRARDRLVDQVLIVAGWDSYPVEHEGSQPVRRDDDVDPPMMYAVDTYRWVSVPA